MLYIQSAVHHMRIEFLVCNILLNDFCKKIFAKFVKFELFMWLEHMLALGCLIKEHGFTNHRCKIFILYVRLIKNECLKLLGILVEVSPRHGFLSL